MEQNQQANAVRRGGWIALGLVFIIALIFRGITVALMPIDWDENFYLNIASNFAERGGLTPYMWRLPADTNIIAGSGTGYGVIPLSLWLQHVHFSFTSGRVLMFMITVANAAVLYAVSVAWWGNRAAGLVTSVVAVTLSSSFASVYVRMDAPGVLVYSLVLWLHIVAVRRKKWWLHVLVGISVIATTEFHILGLLYVAALALYYAVSALVNLWQQRNIRALSAAFWFGVGALVAGVIYLVHHVLPDPEAYFLIPNSCFYCEPASFGKEIERYFRYWTRRPVEMVIAGVMIIMAVFRFRSQDRHYLLVVLGFVIGLGIISPPTQLRYILHGWVLIALGAGGVMSLDLRGWQEKLSRFYVREAFVLASVIALLIFQYFQFDIYRNPPREDKPLQRFALTNEVAYVNTLDLPRETVIMSYVPIYQYFLPYPNFLSWTSGESYGVELRDERYRDMLERERPEVILANTEQAIMLNYVARHEFVQVMDGLYIHPDLCAAGFCER